VNLPVGLGCITVPVAAGWELVVTAAVGVPVQ